MVPDVLLGVDALIARGLADPDRLVRLATAWEKINTAARDAHEYNLDRKPLVFNVFGLLAEATRETGQRIGLRIRAGGHG